MCSLKIVCILKCTFLNLHDSIFRMIRFHMGTLIWKRNGILFWKLKFPFSMWQVYIGNFSWYLFMCKRLLCSMTRTIFGMLFNRCHLENACNQNGLNGRYNCCKWCIHCRLKWIELNAGKKWNANNDQNSTYLRHYSVQIGWLLFLYSSFSIIALLIGFLVFSFCSSVAPPFENWHKYTAHSECNFCRLPNIWFDTSSSVF